MRNWCSQNSGIKVSNIIDTYLSNTNCWIYSKISSTISTNRKVYSTHKSVWRSHWDTSLPFIFLYSPYIPQIPCGKMFQWERSVCVCKCECGRSGGGSARGNMDHLSAWENCALEMIYEFTTGVWGKQPGFARRSLMPLCTLGLMRERSADGIGCFWH